MRYLGIALFAASVVVAACGKSDDKTTTKKTKAGDFETRPGQSVDLDGKKLYEVPKFKLLECRGKPIGKDELKGRVWVASFIFTTCPTHCIAMVGEMERLHDEFKGEKDFAIVASTVDPGTDTPAVLKKFAEERRADPDRWFFLWGQRKLVKDFALGMKISWDADEPLIHSTYFVLVGRNGFVRGVFDNNDRRRMTKMRKVIRQLLAEQ